MFAVTGRIVGAADDEVDFGFAVYGLGGKSADAGTARSVGGFDAGGGGGCSVRAEPFIDTFIAIGVLVLG